MPADQDAKGSDPIAQHKRRARWRLIGALILVGAVAAAAPILLEDQARPLSQDLLIEISPRASAPAPAVVAAPSPAPAAAPMLPKPEEAPKSEPIAKPEPTAKPEAPKTAQSVMVQVGAYATMEAAARVKSRLEGSGHRVTIQTVKTAEGAELHRVRIGPFETREQAIEVRDRAKSQGYDAAIVAAS